jgi:hypothetical protein
VNGIPLGGSRLAGYYSPVSEVLVRTAVGGGDPLCNGQWACEEATNSRGWALDRHSRCTVMYCNVELQCRWITIDDMGAMHACSWPIVLLRSGLRRAGNGGGVGGDVTAGRDSKGREVHYTYMNWFGEGGRG